MKKWIVIIVILAVGGFFGYKWLTANASRLDTQSKARPTTALATRTNIQFSITSAGDIGPAEQVSVRPEINGRIQELPVDIGDVVKKNNILFTLDDKELQTERATTVAEIDGAKLQLERAERNYNRSKQLFDNKLISQELCENAKTEFDLAKNTLERAQKSLSQVEEKLTKTKILAPFDCTVLTRPVSAGQAVSGSGGFNSGTEVMTIANLNDMIINAHINQADVTRLKVGQEVDIEVEAVPGLKIVGTIERLAPLATVRNGIKGFAARITLKNVDPRVRPGMTANMSIPVASAENVVTVPLAAVFTELTDRYVLVKKMDGTFERRSVQVGISDFFFAEIQSGLEPGEEVSLEQPLYLATAGKSNQVAQTSLPKGTTNNAATNRAAPATSTTNRASTTASR